MEWLYQSSEAKCPFYRGEKVREIFCDGIGDLLLIFSILHYYLYFLV